MQMEQEQREHPLANGQTWKLEHGYLHIIELSRRLVHYTILKQLSQQAVSTRLIGIVELLIFLKYNDAELVG
jgi:hypothetical protein